MKPQWVVLLAAVAACGGPPSLTPNRGPTLQVTNRGIGCLIIYDEDVRIATVMPSESRCVALRDPARGRALQYVIEGQTYSTAWFDPTSFAGWRIEVGTTPNLDGLSLRPTDAPCRPGGGHLAP